MSPAKKRGRGRPKKAPTEVIGVRVEVALLRDLRTRAKRLGVPIATLIRAAATFYARTHLAPDMKAADAQITLIALGQA